MLVNLAAGALMVGWRLVGFSTFLAWCTRCERAKQEEPENRRGMPTSVQMALGPESWPLAQITGAPVARVRQEAEEPPSINRVPRSQSASNDNDGSRECWEGAQEGGLSGTEAGDQPTGGIPRKDRP